MDRCRSCGIEVDAQVGACPDCGTPLDAGTQQFPTIMGGQGEIAVESGASSGPVLVVQKGPEIGERFVLDRPEFTLGRDPSSDIFLNDVTVSRRHAVITAFGEQVTVRDVGSLNGTYVNGVRVDETELANCDTVQIGRFQMIFLAGGAE